LAQATLCWMGTPLTLLTKGAEPPIFGSCLLWPNHWVDQHETWHAGRPRPWTHCVLDGDPAPTPKGHRPQFLACICCGPMAAWIKMPLGMEVGLGPGDFVLDKDPAHPPEKGSEPPSRKRGRSHPPQFSVHFYFGQTAGCIKMPLGMVHMDVGLSPGDFVLDGDPAPSPKGGRAPIVGPCLLRPNGSMDQDATWHVGRPRPRRHCVR